MNIFQKSCTYLKKQINLNMIRNSSILIDHEGPVTIIGINNPEKRNCVNYETAQQLTKAIEDFENDENALAAVLYGAGGNFCAGYDLKALSNFDSDIQNLPNLLKKHGTMGPTLRYIKKPMVAAISGYAVAGGLELALMCDLRVMEDNAIMGVYCRRFGVPLIDGGTVRLQACIGLSRALDLILTGRSIEAKEALEWGLVNRIVACGTSLGQAISLATSLVKFPQSCMRADRDSTYNAAFNSSLDRLLEFEQNNGCKVLQESVEGAKKFVSGIGRHGKSYNLTKKKLASWEVENNENIPSSKL